MKLKWLQRTCLVLGHFFRWQSYSLLRATREPPGKLIFVRDYCIALQRTPKKIACSFPRMHMAAACRDFFNLIKQACFWVCWVTRTHILVPLYHQLCKWCVLTPSHAFPAASFPKIAINPKRKKKTRVVDGGSSVPIASTHSIPEARTELMWLCIKLFQHLFLSRTYSKASDSTAAQPEGRESHCPLSPFPCKKDWGKKTHRSQIKRIKIYTPQTKRPEV